MDKPEINTVRRYEPNPSDDWTYSQDCGCRVTFFANSHYHVSQMDTGKCCTLHTARHQDAARDAFFSQAKAALAEYRHVTETIGRYLRCKRHGNTDLYSVVDGEHASGFMLMRQALWAARDRFGPITLSVWDCDLLDWRSEITADPDY